MDSRLIAGLGRLGALVAVRAVIARPLWKRPELPQVPAKGHRDGGPRRVRRSIQAAPACAVCTLERYPEVGSAAALVHYTDAVMDAEPLLVEIGRRMLEVGLDAVLIGNAAAALQGAPVTTVDFDFFFRKTPRKRAAGRPRDKALLEILEKAHAEAAPAARRPQSPEGRN